MSKWIKALKVYNNCIYSQRKLIQTFKQKIEVNQSSSLLCYLRYTSLCTLWTEYQDSENMIINNMYICNLAVISMAIYDLPPQLNENAHNLITDNVTCMSAEGLDCHVQLFCVIHSLINDDTSITNLNIKQLESCLKLQK